MVFSLLIKARVTDLQEYVDILKSELEATKKREKSRKVSKQLRFKVAYIILLL